MSNNSFTGAGSSGRGSRSGGGGSSRSSSYGSGGYGSSGGLGFVFVQEDGFTLFDFDFVGDALQSYLVLHTIKTFLLVN